MSDPQQTASHRTGRNRPGQATAAFLRGEALRMAGLCTECGNCLRACPMRRLAPAAQDVDARTVLSGVRALLRGEVANTASLSWVAACSRSAQCHGVCPVEGLDPAFMMRVAKMRAMGALGDRPQITVQEDSQFSPRVKAFARLTLSSSEQEDWL